MDLRQSFPPLGISLFIHKVGTLHEITFHLMSSDKAEERKAGVEGGRQMSKTCSRFMFASTLTSSRPSSLIALPNIHVSAQTKRLSNKR